MVAVILSKFAFSIFQIVDQTNSIFAIFYFVFIGGICAREGKRHILGAEERHLLSKTGIPMRISQNGSLWNLPKILENDRKPLSPCSSHSPVIFQWFPKVLPPPESSDLGHHREIKRNHRGIIIAMFWSFTGEMY